jgi:putative addiction module CopG family antidote
VLANPFDNGRDLMENSRVMNVSLPSAMEEFVRQRVAAGQFQSPDEVVCEGLRLLKENEAWKADARQKIDLGWEEAKAGQLLTLEEVREELAARKRAWKQQQGR